MLTKIARWIAYSFFVLIWLALPTRLAEAAPPQQAAYNCAAQSEIPQAECEALVSLYSSTGGANWYSRSGWLESSTPCSWTGIACSAGQVSEINLFNNGLSGPLPSTLGSLGALQVLDLGGNSLSGSIPPQLGNLAALRRMNLCCGLTGSIPPELGGLASLQNLTLAYNQLTGSIPPELGNLDSLTYLDLSLNQLSGSIPSSLGSLDSIWVIDLSNNLLSGPLPVELGNLSTMYRLLLGGNDLSGAIPAALGSLFSLTDLNLAGNELSGAIPPELGNLASLREVSLSGNHLSGAVPPQLGSLASLQYLRLSGNDLSGSIPAQLGSLGSLWSLDLSANDLTGSIPPELGNLSSLRYLYLSDNQLSGTIPPALGNLSYLYSLDARNNLLSGGIPAQLGNLSALNWLDLSVNQLTGSIPPELGNCASLRSLFLATNQLSGSIPGELGNLANLETLQLGNNQLTGSIPSQLANLAQLQTLSLSHNALTGSIPAALGSLSNLYSLGLSHNQLEGYLPDELGNLTALWYLTLEYNRLRGFIPPEFGNLSALRELTLNDNQLSGSIPSQLGQLSNLNYLRLSNNQLSGIIPAELGNLTNLIHLILSHNNLMGSVPLAFTKLTNLVTFYFYANPGLCEPSTAPFLAWKATVRYWSGTGNICVGQKPWLLMYYLAGDNDDLSDDTQYFLQLLKAVNNPNVHVAVLEDGLGTASQYVSISDGKVTVIQRGETNTGAPDALAVFMDWARENHPAEHSMLVIFDHGHAFSGVALDETSSGFVDETLTPPEMKQALQQGGKVDVLYIFACLMANLEAEYQLRGLADYYVSSESLGWSSGITTDYIARINPSTTPRQLSLLVAGSYYQKICPSGTNSEDSKTPGTVSVVDMSKINNVTSKTSDLAELIRNNWAITLTQIWPVTDASIVQRFDHNVDLVIDNGDLLADLYDFAQSVSTVEGYDILAGNVMAALDEFVIDNRVCSGPGESDGKKFTYNLDSSHGVSIGLPRTPISYYNVAWLDFAEGADWVISPLAPPYRESAAADGLQWGPFISDLVKLANPTAPDSPNPPDLVAPLEVKHLRTYLPAARR